MFRIPAALVFLLGFLSAIADGKNPILTGADPHAAVINGHVWIYPTRSKGGANFMAFELSDKKTWDERGPVLDFRNVSWLRDDRAAAPWAPCIAQKGTKFFFYYSVGPQSEGHPSRIGVASGNSPAGPFDDSGSALLTGGNGFEAIDPMVFEDPQSRKFYLYVGGSNGSKLRVFELSESMMQLKKEIPVENPKNYTEGPFMHFQGGLYHLTYSHGGWRDSSYSVHHSTSKTPFGPWEYRGAILTSDDHNKGPGHHSIIQYPAGGNWFIIYHRWNNRSGDGPYKGARETCLDKLVHNPDGTIAPVEMTD